MTIQEAQEKVTKAEAVLAAATKNRPNYAPKGRLTKTEADATTMLQAAQRDLKIAQGTIKVTCRNTDSMRDSGNYENFLSTYKREQ